MPTRTGARVPLRCVGNAEFFMFYEVELMVVSCGLATHRQQHGILLGSNILDSNILDGCGVCVTCWERDKLRV